MKKQKVRVFSETVTGENLRGEEVKEMLEGEPIWGIVVPGVSTDVFGIERTSVSEKITVYIDGIYNGVTANSVIITKDGKEWQVEGTPAVWENPSGLTYRSITTIQAERVEG